MEKEQLEKRKVITVRGNNKRAVRELLKEIQTAVEEGYVFPPDGKFWTKDQAQLFGRKLSVVMYPKDYDIPSPGVDTEKENKTSQEYLEEAREADELHKKLHENKEEYLEELKELSKKEELLNFAKDLGIKVPEDMTAPKSIKAFITKKFK